MPVLITKQHPNTKIVTFDSPEFEKMVEQDNQFLSKGKIDWEAKILPIANKIAECEKQLAIPDVALELYLEEQPEFSIDKHKADFEERLVMAKTELANLIALITDKEANDRIEALANQIKEWQEREFTNEAKERNDKIIHNNHLLAKAEFLSQLPNCDESTKAIIKEVEGLEYKQPLPHQYSWKHVALSMLRFPERITFDYDRCPDCGHSRIRIYFYSPKFTWAMMCGVGGDMIICPECKIQAEFNVTIRN